MLHGLLPDSAIVGTTKRIKNAGKTHRGVKIHKPSQDLKDLIDGFREIANIIKNSTKKGK